MNLPRKDRKDRKKKFTNIDDINRRLNRDKFDWAKRFHNEYSRVPFGKEWGKDKIYDSTRRGLYGQNTGNMFKHDQVKHKQWWSEWKRAENESKPPIVSIVVVVTVILFGVKMMFFG